MHYYKQGLKVLGTLRWARNDPTCIWIWEYYLAEDIQIFFVWAEVEPWSMSYSKSYFIIVNELTFVFRLLTIASVT